MFNIDAEFVERLKDEGYDLWTIGQWEQWHGRLPAMADVIDSIRTAFQNVTLGDGIGLYEANGMDDYACEPELARLRELDERLKWQNLDANVLEQYHSAPSFFDPQGFVFHLPAFLLAELNDKHEYGFIDRIVEKRPQAGCWINLLTPQQANALVAILSLVKQHPDYYNDMRKFDFAIERFAKIAGTSNNGG
jgi:hypothetical protein|tara:strand:+ start:1373 stop:1948 length:576 start_codon:yes stop_codon:yes gene_type:complete